MKHNASGFRLQASGDGFTLLEVLIFTSLISLIFIAMAYISIVTLRTTKYNEYKILATRYAEELRDWLKGEKEKDWNTFTRAGTYCFNTSPIPDCASTVASCATSSDNCGLNYILGMSPNNIFKRYVILSNPTSTRVDVKIYVGWKQGQNTYEIPHSTSFTLWE